MTRAWIENDIIKCCSDVCDYDNCPNYACQEIESPVKIKRERDILKDFKPVCFKGIKDKCLYMAKDKNGTPYKECKKCNWFIRSQNVEVLNND